MVQQPEVQKKQYEKPRGSCTYHRIDGDTHKVVTGSSNMNVPEWCLESHKANNNAMPSERNTIGRGSNATRLLYDNESGTARMENQRSTVGKHHNVIPSHQTQGDGYATISGTEPHGNQGTTFISNTNPHGRHLCENILEDSGTTLNTPTTSFFHGAGRAKLAEGARKARFGVSSTSGK